MSACEAHRKWIEDQVRLGRSAMSIYRDLVETKDFTHRYNSVKRFVGKFRSRDPGFKLPGCARINATARESCH